MLSRSVNAVFEKGVFRPLEPLDQAVTEGQEVRLVVEIPESSKSVLDLITQVYAGLSPEDINAVEQIALRRDNFFNDRAP